MRTRQWPPVVLSFVAEITLKHCGPQYILTFENFTIYVSFRFTLLSKVSINNVLIYWFYMSLFAHLPMRYGVQNFENTPKCFLKITRDNFVHSN